MPCLETSRAASHGFGGAQLSPPSETRITVRRPSASPEVVGHGQQRVADRRAPLARQALARGCASRPCPAVRPGRRARCRGRPPRARSRPPWSRTRAGRAARRAGAGRAACRRPAWPRRGACRRCPRPRSSTSSRRARSARGCACRRTGPATRGERAATSSASANRLPRGITAGRLLVARDVPDQPRELTRDLVPDVCGRKRRNDHRNDQQHPQVLRSGLPALAARAHDKCLEGGDGRRHPSESTPAARAPPGSSDPSWHGPKGPRHT